MGVTFVGMKVEERLAVGNVMIRIITKKKPFKLVKYLKSEGYGVTLVNGKGAKGRSFIILTVVKRRDMNKVIEIIKKFNPNAFYSVEDVRCVNKGTFPAQKCKIKIE